MRTKTPWSTLLLLYVLLVGAPALVSQSDSENKRPNKHPDFSDGFRDFKQENWEEAAEHMTAALKGWEEDGELTRVSGRWFEPYLPRYYLGAALLELGCYQAAMNQLDKTILNNQDIKGTKKQKEGLASLKLESTEFLRQGIFQESKHDCTSWVTEVNTAPGEKTDD